MNRSKASGDAGDGATAFKVGGQDSGYTCAWKRHRADFIDSMSSLLFNSIET